MPHETDLLPPGERFSFYLAPARISASSHRYPKVMPQVAFHFLSRFPIKTNCSKPAYFSVFAKIYEGRLRLWSVGAEREGKNGYKNGTGITRHLLLVILYVGSLFLHGLALSPLCSIIYCLSQNWSSSPDDGAGRATGWHDESKGLQSPEGLVLRSYLTAFRQTYRSINVDSIRPNFRPNRFVLQRCL